MHKLTSHCIIKTQNANELNHISLIISYPLHHQRKISTHLEVYRTDQNVFLSGQKKKGKFLLG